MPEAKLTGHQSTTQTWEPWSQGTSPATPTAALTHVGSNMGSEDPSLPMLFHSLPPAVCSSRCCTVMRFRLLPAATTPYVFPKMDPGPNPFEDRGKNPACTSLKMAGQGGGGDKERGGHDMAVINVHSMARVRGWGRSGLDCGNALDCGNVKGPTQCDPSVHTHLTCGGNRLGHARNAEPGVAAHGGVGPAHLIGPEALGVHSATTHAECKGRRACTQRTPHAVKDRCVGMCSTSRVWGGVNKRH